MVFPNLIGQSTAIIVAKTTVADFFVNKGISHIVLIGIAVRSLNFQKNWFHLYGKNYLQIHRYQGMDSSNTLPSPAKPTSSNDTKNVQDLTVFVS